MVLVSPWRREYMGTIKETIMATKSVGDNDFAATVLASGKPVLVDFWAEWCGPCKMIGPSLEEISEELAGQVEIVKLNIDDHPDTPAKYGVRGIPTMILFKGGEIADTKVGAAPKAQLKSWLEAAL
jgi:thioredoxin 1